MAGNRSRFPKGSEVVYYDTRRQLFYEGKVIRVTKKGQKCKVDFGNFEKEVVCERLRPSRMDWEIEETVLDYQYFGYGEAPEDERADESDASVPSGKGARLNQEADSSATAFFGSVRRPPERRSVIDLTEKEIKETLEKFADKRKYLEEKIKNQPGNEDARTRLKNLEIKNDRFVKEAYFLPYGVYGDGPVVMRCDIRVELDEIFSAMFGENITRQLAKNRSELCKRKLSFQSGSSQSSVTPGSVAVSRSRSATPNSVPSRTPSPFGTPNRPSLVSDDSDIFKTPTAVFRQPSTSEQVSPAPSPAAAAGSARKRKRKYKTSDDQKQLSAGITSTRNPNLQSGRAFGLDEKSRQRQSPIKKYKERLSTKSKLAAPTLFGSIRAPPKRRSDDEMTEKEIDDKIQEFTKKRKHLEKKIKDQPGNMEARTRLVNLDIAAAQFEDELASSREYRSDFSYRKTSGTKPSAKAAAGKSSTTKGLTSKALISSSSSETESDDEIRSTKKPTAKRAKSTTPRIGSHFQNKSKKEHDESHLPENYRGWNIVESKNYESVNTAESVAQLFEYPEATSFLVGRALQEVIADGLQDLDHEDLAQGMKNILADLYNRVGDDPASFIGESLKYQEFEDFSEMNRCLKACVPDFPTQDLQNPDFLCRINYKSALGLKNHYKMYHKKVVNGPYTCKWCNEAYRSLPNLMNHYGKCGKRPTYAAVEKAFRNP